MKKSNFSRYIKNFADFKNALDKNFLSEINRHLLVHGKALLVFRDEEATIYYHGNQLCNLPAKKRKVDPFTPTVYDRYLPLCRSKVLNAKKAKNLKAKNLNEREWLNAAGIDGKTFAEVLPEICDNIEKDSSPESTQASRFYRFSPLNLAEDHEIVLLDIEAAFAYPGEQTKRIDLVFYNTAERRLMFVEVKRLSDSRLPKDKLDTSAKIFKQLNSYQDTLQNGKDNIIAQYNNVIEYYNALRSKKPLPSIADADPLLGLLLVEYTSSKKDQDKKKTVQEMTKSNGYKMYAIGNTSNMTKDSTVQKIYNALK